MSKRGWMQNKENRTRKGWGTNPDQITCQWEEKGVTEWVWRPEILLLRKLDRNHIINLTENVWRIFSLLSTYDVVRIALPTWNIERHSISLLLFGVHSHNVLQLLIDLRVIKYTRQIVIFAFLSFLYQKGLVNLRKQFLV